MRKWNRNRMGKRQDKKKRDGKPLLAVKMLVAALPFILRIILVFLKYKRAAKKREKIFRKTLKKEGLEKEVVEKLVEDLPKLDRKSNV